MTSNPHETREVSLTVKYPETDRYKGNGTWLVFRGSVAAVREDLCLAFGMEDDSSLTLADLGSNAQAQAYGQGNVSSGLGGRTIGNGGASSSSSSTAAAPAKDPEPEADPLLTEIANLSDLKSHANCWADNKAALQANAEALEAWKAKGRELKAAA